MTGLRLEIDGRVVGGGGNDGGGCNGNFSERDGRGGDDVGAGVWWSRMVLMI